MDSGFNSKDRRMARIFGLFAGSFRSVTNSVIDALFPHKCAACDALFHPPKGDPFFGGIGELRREAPLVAILCPECLAGIRYLSTPVYGGELKSPRHFRMAWSPAAYVRENPFDTVIHRFKYDHRVELADALGLLLFADFCRYFMGRIDIVAPVPLHPHRLRRRGFNQAWLLIRIWPKLATRFGVDLSNVRLERELLLRVRKTRPQVGLGVRERDRNIWDAFVVNAGMEVMEKRILLVDDVLTTGATAGECARVLLEAGAAYANLLTLARAESSPVDEAE